MTASDKLEIMLREGSFLVGVGGSLIALSSLLVKLSNSEYALDELIIGAAFIVFGLGLVYHSVDKHKLLWALAADPSLVTGTLEPARTTTEEIDGTTFYRVAYDYQFDGMTYSHCVETSRPEKYGAQESIFIQRSRPANAVFAADLPSVVREKLLSATSNQFHAQ
ncbi:hypothetical protein [Hymenobacter ruricola]|uniref:DUF3592 domain-containing protein n=1 Tax=Hymenobacter ruricola TaxID=2791023 RepID=A0ABS0IB03_9BACT|nr:hypothetical protein [Hymenobacter ruricola]MBF9224130.1 hypothetical protein [Hymenobacter ruricola]